MSSKKSRLVQNLLHQLHTCYTQQNSTQGHPSSLLCLFQKFEHVIWGESFINMWIPMEDIINTNSTDAQQPGQDNRCKETPHTVSAIMLKGKQKYQYYTSHWNLHICHNQLTNNQLQSNTWKFSSFFYCQYKKITIVNRDQGCWYFLVLMFVKEDILQRTTRNPLGLAQWWDFIVCTKF